MAATSVQIRHTAAAEAEPPLDVDSPFPVPIRPGELRTALTGSWPLWVVDTTGVPGRTLLTWRSRGWLTPPGPDRWERTMPGRGGHFDWHSSIAQITWLARLAEHGRVLDNEDAAGGWRLRAAGATTALRVGLGRWRAWDPQNVDDVAALVEADQLARTLIEVSPA